MYDYPLSDEKAIILLNEWAKTDNKALKLMVLLQNAKEWGERDILISQIHSYIRDHND